MNNGQQYHHSGPSVRPSMDLRSQRSPPPSNAHCHQHNYIPQSSFLGHSFTEDSFSQATNRVNAFHSGRFPPVDLSRPPPSLEPSAIDLFASNREMQQQGYRMPPPLQTFGSSLAPAPLPGVGTHLIPPNFSDPIGHMAPPTYSDPISHMAPPTCCDPISHMAPPTFSDPISHTNMESSCPQSTSGELAIYEGPTELKEKGEKIWLRNFEQRILGRSSMQQHESNTAKKKPLKLLEVQQMVSQSRILTDKLGQLKEKMSLLRNDTQDQVWWELLNQAENIKLELSVVTQKFQDKDFMENVRQLIHQRRKKRERKKKSDKVKNKQRKELKMMWKKEEEKIDAWREKLQLKEEEKRREIAIKTEADSILGEVRQKQTDGFKMQQLLENLISLRIVRLNKGATHGYISTPQKDHLFTTTLNNISKVVKAQMEEYKLEEQTLQVMMEESTSCHRSSAGKRLSDSINKLETIMKKMLYGDMAPIDQETYEDFTAADHSLETLIQRRNDWDQFICEEDIPLASSVPLSWVIPPTQPTSSWKEFQG